jgi:hypothetical protein
MGIDDFDERNKPAKTAGFGFDQYVYGPATGSSNGKRRKQFL